MKKVTIPSTVWMVLLLTAFALIGIGLYTTHSVQKPRATFVFCAALPQEKQGTIVHYSENGAMGSLNLTTTEGTSLCSHPKKIHFYPNYQPLLVYLFDTPWDSNISTYVKIKADDTKTPNLPLTVALTSTEGGKRIWILTDKSTQQRVTFTLF